MGTTLKLKLLKKRKKAERIQREIDFVGTRVCQEKCVSFIKFPYWQFSKLPVLYAESTLLIFEKGVLYPYAIF